MENTNLLAQGKYICNNEQKVPVFRTKVLSPFLEKVTGLIDVYVNREQWLRMRAMSTSLTAGRLRELLSYDPETGVFTRRVATGRHDRHKAGEPVGWRDPDGYVLTSVDGRDYRTHRLAWLYVHGTWPAAWLDHIDGNTSNNRISNLREATPAQNAQNQRLDCRASKSGLLGAHWNKGRQTWFSRIQYNGRSKHLGNFETPELAHEFHCLAKAMIHPFGDRG